MINWKFYSQEVDGDNIFTEGSRIEDEVGCALFTFMMKVESRLKLIEVESRKIRLSDGATVLMAEVVAIKEEVEYIREKDMRNVRVLKIYPYGTEFGKEKDN
ncbi:hypothetical protein AVEN_68344-1 [Araneus ventricosus]|uniref:Uncharacterized protein n=1 Tax=Araneus ventricosus TaxID=182803 RepID=A0A4Y2IUH8_ARAVE|nr:hypothetical protein AVEN_68344-1 [Araneus ventricosus]